MTILAAIQDYTVSRDLNTLYIMLDIVFLLLLGYLLLKTKRKHAFFFGIAGALIYFIVDYGIFYLLLRTREVDGANTMLFLLWLSTSYGFTNFAWIWLFLDKDKRIIEWSSLIVIGWLSTALISQSFGSNFAVIHISREVGSYHGWMAIMLFAGYAFVIIRNLMSDNRERLPILKMLFIGIFVQFSWEAILLITGIRPQGWNPLVINSLLETNLGIPYIYFIHKVITKRFSEAPVANLSHDKFAQN